MAEETLERRRDRIHAIVEGALLGDIAIVFLLMRAFLPVLFLRPILLALAAVSFVMLLQRRGVRMTILASIAAYILFSALVGPILAIKAIDTAVAAVLIGLGRKAGLGAALNTLWTGPVYALFDLIIPTVAGIIIFRYPVKDLIKSAQNFVHLVFNALRFVLDGFHASPSVLHQVRSWEAVGVSHWQYGWLGTMVLYGWLNMYLVAIVAEMVLKQIPVQTLVRQRAA